MPAFGGERIYFKREGFLAFMFCLGGKRGGKQKGHTI